ncbi:MAG: hypothetical protein OEW11_05660 [Nitrospirota bacterium]|nr:hypothetical protein [Nitrospirota bacterium]
MTPKIVIERVRADGVHVFLTTQGTIQLKGSPDAVAKWTPVVRDRKPELLTHLQGVAANDPAPDPAAQVADRLARGATQAMRSGTVPQGWNQPLLCEGCGAVPWGVAGTAVMCPWCWVRMDGLPVPRITGSGVMWG